MLCICLPFVAGKSFAQRYLPGQKGIQLTLGGVDDFGSNVKHLHGNFQVGLALSRITGTIPAGCSGRIM